jgi:hypothetical protein
MCSNRFWKKNFISSSPFALLIINVKILFNFYKEWCTFDKKKGHLKITRIVNSQGLSALNMQKHFWFVSSFEHVNFAVNRKYFKKINDNSNYYVFLVIFQTYKNAISRNVHSLGLLLWLWFYLFQSSKTLHIYFKTKVMSGILGRVFFMVYDISLKPRTM